jgi:hypothetical protein
MTAAVYDALAWATAHPYLVFFGLLALLIIYSKFIYPRELK